MHIHPEEIRWAQVNEKQLPFEPLNRDQVHSIMERGRELHRGYKSHYVLHCLINLLVLVVLLGGDYLALLRLPGLWLAPGSHNPAGAIAIAGVISGLLHCWLMYSLAVFTMHEGAAHRIIFPPRGPFSRFGNFATYHLARITGGVPDFYSEKHMIHHSRFGTEEDAEFLNFVTPRRYWMTFLPLAVVINFSDFVLHRPANYTRSRWITLAVALLYQVPYMYLAYRLWGVWFTILVLMLFTQLGFYLDRLRQFTEHNLMPLDNLNGSRSFGFGFWGMLVGGGPWGTPCHWEHHLVASLPWYQQLRLHRHVVSLLTPRQRKQFLITPVIGFPILWLRVLRESYSLMRAAPNGIEPVSSQ
jgi:fatty acid desaturase